MSTSPLNPNGSQPNGSQSNGSQSNGQPNKPSRDRLKRSQALLITAGLAGLVGLCGGIMMRFSLSNSSSARFLSPLQTFPDLANWTPELPQGTADAHYLPGGGPPEADAYEGLDAADSDRAADIRETVEPEPTYASEEESADTGYSREPELDQPSVAEPYPEEPVLEEPYAEPYPEDPVPEEPYAEPYPEDPVPENDYSSEDYPATEAPANDE
jgi:hypothetical protein